MELFPLTLKFIKEASAVEDAYLVPFVFEMGTK